MQMGATAESPAADWAAPGMGAVPEDQACILDWTLIMVPNPGDSCIQSQWTISMLFILWAIVFRYGNSLLNGTQLAPRLTM